MICRRCGMDSSTTDTCEWCKKPMLPPGAAISAQAKEQILKEKAEAEEAAAKPQAPPPPKEEITPEELARPGVVPLAAPTIEVPGLTALGAHLTQEDATPQAAVLSTTEQTINDAILRPLGSATAGGRELEENADKTLYVGNDENLLRPIERPTKDGSQWTIDASGRRRRVVDETPEVPEKVRLFRATLHAGIVCMLSAIVEFVVIKDHKMPSQFVVLPVPGASDGAITAALVYGVYMTVLMGFMLGALLVTKKWGGFVGMLIGCFGCGMAAQLNSPENMKWTAITGAIAGIVAGRAAVKGVKRIVSV